jgi:hypothetical protein
MNTKFLMSSSAAFMAILGVAATFAPQEILAHYGFSHSPLAVLPLQVAGALYLGFAILNWMARGNLIGGIHSRPVAVGNFFHFAVVAVTMLKLAASGSARSEIIAGAVVCSVFAAHFGYVVFTSPRPSG